MHLSHIQRVVSAKTMEPLFRIGIRNVEVSSDFALEGAKRFANIHGVFVENNDVCRVALRERTYKMRQVLVVHIPENEACQIRVLKCQKFTQLLAEQVSRDN